MYQNIVLHIPHSSTVVPAYLEKQNPSAVRSLRSRSFYLVDYHTHSLFLPSVAHPLVHSIVAPYLRMLVDMERMPNDPLETKGFGIVSRWAIDSFGEAFRKQAFRWHLEYHRAAMMRLNALKHPLLLDCHSFSAHPTPLCPVAQDVDICIGWNEDETTPDRMLLGLVAAYFMDCGYSVGINKPFSNSKTFPGASGYHSLMLEVNKHCYMNEDTLEVTAGYYKLHTELQELYKLLLN